jgi:hypothetical protein
MAKGARPEARAAAMAKVEPQLPYLAHLAIKAQALQVRQSASPLQDPGPVTRHAPTPDDGAGAPAAPAASTEPCGGVSVLTDPSALSCRN